MTVAKARRDFLATIVYYLLSLGPTRPCADVRQGIIAAANRDGRKIVNKGEPANFLVYYPVDDDTSKHNLTLDGSGADDRWPLGAVC